MEKGGEKRGEKARKKKDAWDGGKVGRGKGERGRPTEIVAERIVCILKPHGDWEACSLAYSQCSIYVC